jgi:hypothetical protein
VQCKAIKRKITAWVQVQHGGGCVSLLLRYIEEAHTKHTPEGHTPFINKFNLPSLLAKTTSSSESDFKLMGTQVRSLQTTKTNFIAPLLFG